MTLEGREKAVSEVAAVLMKDTAAKEDPFGRAADATFARITDIAGFVASTREERVRWTREDVAGLRAAADELRRIFRVIDAIDGVMGDVHASLRAQTERAEQLTRVFDERHPDSANAMRRMMQVFSFSSRPRAPTVDATAEIPAWDPAATRFQLAEAEAVLDAAVADAAATGAEAPAAEGSLEDGHEGEGTREVAAEGVGGVAGDEGASFEETA